MRRLVRPPVEKRHSMLLTLVVLLAAPVLPAVGITFTTDTTINTTQYVGQDIVVQSCTLTIDCSSGIGNYNSITLNSGVLTHPAGSANGLWLNIAGTVAVDPWSQINVNGRGHQGGTGPGVGSVAGAGGTYGGTGVGSTTPVYGSYSMPAELGSGGAARPGYAGGAGGGLIRITCGGTFDNQGVIYALGNNATAAGAGSGGGVYIACDTYAGGGAIYADGGDVDTSGVPADEIAGGGGGGRVALHYSARTNTGQVSCRGGWGVDHSVGWWAGPGTRYWKDTALPTADLDFWNDGRGGWTRQPAIDATDVNLSVISGYVEFDCSADPVSVNTMRVLSGTITHPPADEDGLRIVTVGDMYVDWWASVNVDGRGYPADTGPGAGSGPGAGGTYGGTGQGSTAPVYGSWATPQELGSGGATNGAETGGSGGGRIQLDVGGTLTLEGNLRACGSNATRAGAGSGGSIQVTCGTLESSGFMMADGGYVDASGLDPADTAGGGGGGRIALHYTTSTFTGGVYARGDYGVVANSGCYGGPGTRYWEDTGTGTKSLDFWNEGRYGWTNQPALSIPDTILSIYSSWVQFDCSSQQLNVKKLNVQSSTISHPAGSAAGLDVVVVEDMLVDYWAVLNADGRGHGPNSGPGAGAVPGSGGTYGGTGQASDASVYGSFANPTDMGSGGVDRGTDTGGSGGGRIQLSVGGTLTLEGNLRSRGSNALRAGAGSGGTIQVTCGTLTSSGFMLADGGDVDNSGLPADQTAGGGGGGRVALHYGSSTYTGSVWSRGGWGVVAGTGYYAGPGTRYWLDDGAGTKSLDFYNEGRGGWTMQPALSIPDTDLNLYYSNVEFDCGLQPLSVKKLSVLSSTISHPAGSAAGLDIATVGDMHVDWWASVNVDGRGHPSNSGPGAGTAVGSGATYGGTGVASDAAVYGSFSNPTDLGSGGVNNGADLGGSGGGRIQLSVGGTLTMEGNLRSRGSNAVRAGAGSGGTIQVTCGTLTSSGFMLADGGDVDNTGLPAEQAAGGGGGGRIALLYGSSTYTGTVWSRGGWGVVAGSGYYAGPGTRYWEDFGASSKTLDFWNEGRGGWTKQPALSIPDVHFNLHSCNVELDCSLQRMAVRTLGVHSSILSHPPASPEGLQVIAGDTIYVDNWSQINAEGRGLPAEVGSGRGTNGAGGGYGGAGGYNTLTYGAREMPLHLGSGGGGRAGGTGGTGGGRISLTTTGTIQLDGQIYAMGGNAPFDGGGGSGGSALLVGHELIGSGVIYAYGGNANYQATNVGGGGGGRVAVYTNPGQAWWPGGGINVGGGWGTEYGAVGTIYHGETVAGTDLQLTEDFQWEWQADGSGQGTVTVFNVGNTGCGAFKVGLYDRDPALSGAVLMDTADVPSLGAVDGVSVDLTAPTPVTSNTLWVKVDYENGVTETNELNNVRFFTIPRIGSSLYVLDRTGTIGELVSLRGKLKRVTDNAWLQGKTVHYKVDGTLVGSGVTNVDGLAEYLWIIANGPATRTINGAFYGDAEYSPSTDDGTLNAQTWQTKMSGIDRTGPIASYRILKAWLWKMDNTPIPGKSILFKLDGTVLGSDNTRPTGYAQIGYTIADGAGAGVRTIRAEWAGDGGYLPSAVNNKLTVTKATPYIWVMPRTVVQGGIARFYAYFRRLPDYQKQEGKTLSFKIDGTWIVDVVTLTGAEAGIARYNYTTVESVGDHTLRCEFAGDAWVDAGYGEGLLRILAP